MEVIAFEPPFWLANRHLQSILPSSPSRRAFVARRAARLTAASRELLIDCGDGVRLHGHYAGQPGGARNLVLLVHGWEGSAEAQYVLSAGQYLYARGFEVFRLNLRDHGPTHRLNPELFHSCRIAEVVGAVRSVQELFPDRALSLVGHSLGGNFALRVAVRAPAAGIRLRQVVAICPVLDPQHTLGQLERGLWIYRNYFVLKWRSSLQLKHEAWPDLYDLDELMEHRNLTRMTEDLVLRYTDFPDLVSYLNGYAIVGDRLAGLEVPARIIAALDDPIIPAGDLARLARPPSLRITVTRKGGHCGFLETLTGESWADRQVHETLATAAD
ncbi:MAG TPA: alpha/beta fold hydrolase [Steroidobacteraceae bacterium]|nr:alpha/beta fold hydrolase [Steroidobacteraceae bacterium]